MNKMWKTVAMVALLACGFMFVAGAVEPAAAQAALGSSLTKMITSITSVIAGPVGRALGVLAVMILGLTVLFGRMDIQRAGAVVMGLGIIFGASEIVTAFVGS